MAQKLTRCIRVRDDTWVWLNVIKARHHFRDVDSVIQRLIKDVGGSHDKGAADCG